MRFNLLDQPFAERRAGLRFDLRHPFTRVLLVAVVAVIVAACERGDAGRATGEGALEGPVNVVTTVGMIADLARHTGGDCVDVTALMGPGVDPHLYRASASDVDRLRRADIILFGGLGLEGRMSDVLERLQGRVVSVPVLEALPESELLDHPTYEGSYDPHLWMDVGMWARSAPTVAETLAEAQPDCRDAIEQRVDDYVSQLEALDRWVAASVASIPEAQRVLVTAHDAFHYFGRAYDVDVVGIQGVSTESEASLADIRQVVETITSRRIPALFVESSVNPRNIEAVRAAVADRGFDVRIGGELFSDAMGPANSWQGTYIGMIRSNVVSIVEALGGTIAPWPDELGEWAERWGLS